MLHWSLSGTAGSARRHIALRWRSQINSAKFERIIQVMQSTRGLAFTGERGSTWHGCSNGGGNGQWLQNTSKRASSTAVIPSSYTTLICHSNSNVRQQGQQLRRHLQQTAAYGGQPVKYDKRSSTSESGGRGWNESSNFGRGTDRRSGIAGAHAARRQLQDVNARQHDDARQHVSRQHSEREDGGAPSWEAASESASSEGSEVSQKWQLFPPQRSGQQQQRPAERRRRQPPPVPLNSPLEESVTLSHEQYSADDTSFVQQTKQSAQIDARQQRSAKGTGAFEQTQTAERPASVSQADTIPLDEAAARSGDHFFEPDSSFEALGLHPQVVAALQRAGLRRPSRVQVFFCHRKVLHYITGPISPDIIGINLCEILAPFNLN